MKTIAMIRHAKSSWTSGIISDKLRPLNQRGQRDAPFMAGKLKSLLPTIEHLAISSATRTIETSEAFISLYGPDIHNSQHHDQLYHGMPEDYESVLFGLDDEISSVAMIGHNPGMTMMANQASTKDDIDNIATCGIFVLQTDVDRWVDFSFDRCSLLTYIYPKMYV